MKKVTFQDYQVLGINWLVDHDQRPDIEWIIDVHASARTICHDNGVSHRRNVFSYYHGEQWRDEISANLLRQFCLKQVLSGDIVLNAIKI